MDGLSKQDKICIARNFQQQLFRMKIKDSIGNISNECALCEYRNQCYQLKDGELKKYRYHFKELLYKLQQETGIYLGFDR